MLIRKIKNYTLRPQLILLDGTKKPAIINKLLQCDKNLEIKVKKENYFVKISTNFLAGIKQKETMPTKKLNGNQSEVSSSPSS